MPLKLPLGTTPALTGPSAPALRFLPLKPLNGFIVPPLLPSPLNAPGSGPPCGHSLFSPGAPALLASPSNRRFHLLHLDPQYIPSDITTLSNDKERIHSGIPTINTYDKAAASVASPGPDSECCCLILQDLLQSCSRGGKGIVEDMCS